ncbi:MAG: hypothetical protein AM1032_000087 [Mycoplasmataceae bacterium]|nr:MAG: hypothetical protein AM1032_000087 [Mycoplasmataceae bacterium]
MQYDLNDKEFKTIVSNFIDISDKFKTLDEEEKNRKLKEEEDKRKFEAIEKENKELKRKLTELAESFSKINELEAFVKKFKQICESRNIFEEDLLVVDEIVAMTVEDTKISE